MKKGFFLLSALLFAAVGCNKDAQEGNNGIGNGDNVYMSFSIQTLTTRSGTDESGNTNSDASPDFEVGQDYENKISSVEVVLRNENSYISSSFVTPVEEADTLATSPKKWIATFPSSQLVNNTQYQVYIYANCGGKIDVNAESNVAISEMTAQNKFWMTNAYEPQNITFESYSTDKGNPTDLGTHYVERAMARFDYMDRGEYTLVEDNDGTADVDETIKINLTEAALINQSKAFYLLRRVSQDGTSTNWTVGGAERLNNYVVDTDWNAKKDGYQEADAANFDFHMTNAASWKWKSIKNLDKVDNWDGKDDGTTGAVKDTNHVLNDYYIWQYAKENTIPSGADNQVNGNTTGIVFKGEITGALVTAAAGQPIYVYENTLYGTWDKVVDAAAQPNATEAFKFAVSKCNNDGQPKDAETLSNAGFTGYSADKDGKYYTYYYYWNRHNDNAQNTVMGTMEFAVVRNNVYKICVDNIAKFGHPTPGSTTDPDPDPVDPTDPDEKGEYYFKVTVKVLPWVVRVNHIEF